MFTPRPEGNFQFVPGSGMYCKSVMAMPGYSIVHATFVQPQPLARGFDIAKQHLAGLGRPMQAMCAAELRITDPLSFDGFGDFNKTYIALLDAHGLRVGEFGALTRTNVSPASPAAKPGEPSLFAFSYTVPGDRAENRRSFVLSGMGEVAGAGRDTIVALGDTSPDGMRKKANWVMGRLNQRMAEDSLAWRDATWVNLYTVHHADAVIETEMLNAMGSAASLGVHWFFSRPPILELEFEADVRGVGAELFL